MNKAVKTIAVASFFFAFVGCSSDDNSKTPEGPSFEDKQLISHVKSTYYWTDEEYYEDGTTQVISGKDYQIDFNFSYDDHLALSALTYKVTYYKDDEILKVTDGEFSFKLNAENQLQTLEITGDPMYAGTYLFTYANDILTKLEFKDNDQNFTQNFTYNAENQFIKSDIQAFNLNLDYTYNAQKQISKIQSNRNELPEQIEYDTQNNPFKDLPFDLTSVLFEGINYIPLTYTFPNNIKGFKTPYFDTYQLEYKYDENNNPLKATVYYISDNQPKELDYEIDYSYITKKVEIVK
ncbi:hypothetical protein [Myroides sp. DF42-4-2]|uniref:hypothetical protein n=1 Tax=unclassified Myroides TaxID=2642485 RepID=UPI0025772316|nr:hypothetical protein [Myroides sp. DF42-4-2]MDM1408469.1 hypothetical protein [Myroides sp. DF42-4-2]